MKQSILALGAAAALGFTGAAHAIAYFGPGATTPTGVPEATTLGNAVGGIGHMLYMPYYNAQEGSQSMLSITNTDSKNGKVVKVRFRAADNSDDVLDFTLLLSPGDVWTASLARNAEGTPLLATSDTSCMLPQSGLGTGVPFSDSRLSGLSALTSDIKLKHMSEGYVEVLNMADIPPAAYDRSKDDNNQALYYNIKHQNGKPFNCSGQAQEVLISTDIVDAAGAEAAGLTAPTGQLMGSWIVMNQNQLSSYSGNMTAIRAVDKTTGANGYGNIIFAPQRGEDAGEIPLGEIANAPWGSNYTTCSANVGIGCITADPLLGTASPRITPLWYDLPDMSTPLMPGFKTPQDQVTAMDISHNQIINEYVADESGDVPMTTDWIVSQPTRRYYAAVEYSGALTGGGRIVYNTTMGANGTGGVANSQCFGSGCTTATNNPYATLAIPSTGATDGYPAACLMSGVTTGSSDREEGALTGSSLATFSPGRVVRNPLCGEVFVMPFSTTAPSSVNAQASVTRYDPQGKTAGWAHLTFENPIPTVGFAAVSMKNNQGATFGATWAHRWN